MRRETGFFEGIINALTHSGTTITRTEDFLGRRKTVVHNYDTGITKEYTHGQGFWGDRTDVKVFREGKAVASGNVKKDFWGRGIVTMHHKGGRVKTSIKRMDMGFFGDRDSSVYYDKKGQEVGNAQGRKGWPDTYTRHYQGKWSRYN